MSLLFLVFLAISLNLISLCCSSYLIGCVAVSSDGSFTFISAPSGTWFNRRVGAEWDSMLNAHCGSLTTRLTNIGVFEDFHIEIKKEEP